MAYDEKLASRIRKELDSRTDFVEKQMFGGVAFMVRGHMSCGVAGPSLMVRLDPAEGDRRLREPNVRPMDFTGRPMRGFLFVDAPAIATAASLRKWLGRAVGFAETRPVKASKKPARRPRPRSQRA
jgi:hypothetical protein